jgi:hypothetical protein
MMDVHMNVVDVEIVMEFSVVNEVVVSLYSLHYPKEKQRYIFVKEPSPKKYWKCFSKHKFARWKFDVMLPNSRWEACYDEQTSEWYNDFGMLPAYDDYFWCDHHKHLPNKKTILRVLRKWNLPKGTKVILNCFRYYGLDFEIIVK